MLIGVVVPALRRVVPVLLCFCMTFPAWGAASDFISEDAFFGEMPVVLSVSRLSQPISEAPGAVTVIDRDLIRSSGARDISDLFRLVPGFYSGSFRGNEPVTSHGITGRLYGRIQVLVDGRSVYTPLFGQVPWTSIPVHLEDIERIEVTRGPNAASYGANSFMSVVNIITRHAQEDQGAVGMARAGSAGIVDGMVRYGGRQGDLDYRITAGYQSDDGAPDLHDFRRMQMVSGRGDYRLNVTDALQFQFGFSHGDQGQGRSDGTLDPPNTQHLYNAFMQFKWQRTSGIDDETSLQFYFTSSDSKQHVNTIADGLVQAFTYDLNTKAERYDLEFQRNQALGRDVRLAWGASARLDRIYAPVYLNTESTFDTDLYRLFANLEWRVAPSLVVNAGAMGEHNSITGSAISPRAAVAYHFLPGQTLRLGISSAKRTPTILENSGDYYLKLPITGFGTVWFPYYFGPGNLKPEHILSREIGYRGEWQNLGLEIDLRLYREHISDIIDVAPVYQPVLGLPWYYSLYGNRGQLDVDGVETQIGWRGQNSRLWLTHAYRRPDSPNPDYVSATPSHIYGLQGSYKFPNRFEASLGYYHVGALSPISDGTALPGHSRLDVRLAKLLDMGGKQTEVSLVFQNLLGSYFDYNDKNKIEPRAFLMIRSGF